MTWILLSLLYAVTNAVYTTYYESRNFNGYVLGIWRGFGISLLVAPLLFTVPPVTSASYYLILIIQGLMIGIYDSLLFFASGKYGSHASSGFMATCVLITVFLWWGIDFSELAALLRTPHAQARKLSIAPNKPDEAVRALRADFFADAVQIAVGETAAIRRKPAPDMLLAAMEQLGADPDKTVFVGDSEVDIATARAADLPCISVLWGFRARDVLEHAGAQQFAADIAQLQALLG